MKGNGDTDASDLVRDLRETMRGWNWTPEEIERTMPALLKILVDVGLLRSGRDGTYETTDLVNDEDAWAEVWSRVERSGIGGMGAS